MGPPTRLRMTFNRAAYTDQRHGASSIHNLKNSKPNSNNSNAEYNSPYGYRYPSPSPPAESAPLTYRSPFRQRIVPARSPKRQKRSPAEPGAKTRLSIELFVFLTAYTSLWECIRLDVVERVFGNVDWEECADADEARGESCGELFSIEEEDEKGLGRVWRGILELPEVRVTSAFGELIGRMEEEGWSGDGILIPPAVQLGTEEVTSEEMQFDVLNWSVAYNRRGSREPIMYQAVPELAISERPLYELDHNDPNILAERESFYQGYLLRSKANDLEQARLQQENRIERHYAACEAAQNAARRRYWELVRQREALTIAGGDESPSSSSITNREVNEAFPEKMVSAVSSEPESNDSSPEPEGCARARRLPREMSESWGSSNLSDPADCLTDWVPKNLIDWALKISKSPAAHVDDSSGQGVLLLGDDFPELEPFPPAPMRPCSPKRKAAEAGLAVDQWVPDLRTEFNWQGQPMDEYEENRMLEQALMESMADVFGGELMEMSAPLSDAQKQENKKTDSELAGLGIGTGQSRDAEGGNSSLTEIGRCASLGICEVTTRMDSLATRTLPIPQGSDLMLGVSLGEEDEAMRQLEMAIIRHEEARGEAAKQFGEVSKDFEEIRRFVDGRRREREREEYEARRGRRGEADGGVRVEMQSRVGVARPRRISEILADDDVPCIDVGTEAEVKSEREIQVEVVEVEDEELSGMA